MRSEHWELSHHLDAHFERLEDHSPMAVPEPTSLTLATCMEKQFPLDPLNAAKLAIWLAETLLPGYKPPTLVITGKAREAAVEKIRNLIDPVIEPIIETPSRAEELRRMVLENKVLAFSVNDPI